MNWRDHTDTPIPLTLTGVDGVENLENLQLVINGAANRHTVTYRNGGLVIVKNGLSIFLR